MPETPDNVEDSIEFLARSQLDDATIAAIRNVTELTEEERRITRQERARGRAQVAYQAYRMAASGDTRVLINWLTRYAPVTEEPREAANWTELLRRLSSPPSGGELRLLRPEEPAGPTKD